MVNLELWLDYFVYIVFPIFILSIIFYIIRIIKGPTIPDMVLAVNCLSYDLATFICLLALYFRSPILIGGAMCLALWAYALDLYVSKYLEGKEMGE